jgi:peptide/nickel transport system substrate-binding protein
MGGAARPRLLSGIGIVCVLPLLAAAWPARAAQERAATAPVGQITVGMTQFPDTLSPYQSGIATDLLIEDGMFAPYAYVDGHGRLVPDVLADIPSVHNHQILNQGRTVILKLRPYRY